MYSHWVHLTSTHLTSSHLTSSHLHTNGSLYSSHLTSTHHLATSHLHANGANRQHTSILAITYIYIYKVITPAIEACKYPMTLFCATPV